MKQAGGEQEKIDFFLISAHELRTSLSAMKWMFRMLLDGDFGSLNETQMAMIAQAQDSNERMITLLSDTMHAIKLGAPYFSYEKTPFQITELTEEVIKDFTNEAAGKGMHIRYTPHPTPLIVLGDEKKLRIALHNLLENAIKYGTQNTDITITLSVDGGAVSLHITNQGIGVPKQEQEKLFEKFFRASNTADTLEGVGLGLYATRFIVEQQGGKLALTSSSATDTTFTITLPLG